MNLKAERLPNGGCVKATWKKIESAECKVKYLMTLKDAYGKIVDVNYGHNIKEMKMCNVLPHVHITEVQLMVQFRTVSKTVTANIRDDGLFPSQKKIYPTRGQQSSLFDLRQ